MSDGKPVRVFFLGLCVFVFLACDRPSTEAVSATTPDESLPEDDAIGAAELPQLLVEARRALAAGQAMEAANAAQRALTVDSTHAELNNLLATTLVIQGQNEAGIASAERALRHHPDYALAHLNLGGIYFRLQQFEKAEQHLLRAIELDPQQASLHRRLADLYRTTQRPELAVESIRRASQLLPASAALSYLLGMSQEQAGDESAAFASYRRASELDPSLLEAWERISALGEKIEPELGTVARARLGGLQALEPQMANQFGQLRHAILSSPEDPSQHYRLGAFLLQHDMPAEALNRLQRAAVLQPGDARLLNHIGGLLMRAERLDDALPFYMRASEVNPDDATGLMNAGALRAMQEKIDEALTLIERALERSPNNPQIHYYYGLTLMNAGDRPKARTVLQKGLELAGDSDLAGQIQNALNAIAEAE